MVFLVPLSWISFSLLDLTSSITGGLVEDLNVALASLGAGGGFLSFLAGLVMVLFFPIHWCLTYRPDDVLLIISVILPWILTCTITSAISSHSPRGGLHTSLAIGIGYIIVGFAFYFILPMIINIFLPGGGAFASAILDGLSAGLTDLPYLLAVLLAVLEGCLVGSVFGAFIGSLKYKPAGGKAKVKKKEVIAEVEPTLDGTDFCTNCGAKVPPGVDFCTNCGSKMSR
ncbi:MAG: zinc ribbon domain-containing protein [Candidatus Hermodarchaeota archaeon]